MEIQKENVSYFLFFLSWNHNLLSQLIKGKGIIDRSSENENVRIACAGFPFSIQFPLDNCINREYSEENQDAGLELTMREF